MSKEPIYCFHNEELIVKGHAQIRRCTRCPAYTVAVDMPPMPLPPWVVGERAVGGDCDGSE